MAECFKNRKWDYQGGGVKIVTWQNGTPAQIAAMIAAADAGKITLSDYWSIGDERTVHLNAIAANPNGAFTTAMDAQDVVMVLMNEGYMNQQGIHYVVGQKDCLNQKGRMNATNTTTGSWASSLMRVDLNNLYYNAIADSDYKALFKQFTVTTGNGTASGLQTSSDLVALFAAKEVFGLSQYASQSETSALSQIEYYTTANNRRKYYNWWLRSPEPNYSEYFDDVTTSKTENGTKAANYAGIAPFMCI